MSGETTPDESVDAVVVRRSAGGWQVGDEQVADLTSAMVLADLLAADPGLATECRGAALESWQLVHGGPGR